MVISAPALKQGSAYALYTGGTGTGDAAGLYTAYSGGAKLCTITLSAITTSVSDSGQAVSGGMGGGMGGGGGPGGMGGRR